MLDVTAELYTHRCGQVIIYLFDEDVYVHGKHKLLGIIIMFL